MNVQEALEAASRVTDVSLVKAALFEHTDVNAADKNDNTALHQAINSGYELLVKELLDKKADIDRPNAAGQTPLYHAISSIQPYVMVGLLLHRGAKVNVQSNSEWNPLSKALQLDNNIRKPVIRLLLQHGAYSYLGTTSGDTLTDFALQNYWQSASNDIENNAVFYTSLLFAGVPVPPGVVLPRILLSIQDDIQRECARRLSPLGLSRTECNQLVPDILHAIPRLREWHEEAISGPKVIKSLAGKLFEATAGNEEDEAFFDRFQRSVPAASHPLNEQKYETRHQELLEHIQENKALMQALEEEVPMEIRDGIKEAFIQQNLPALVPAFVSYKAQKTYGFSPEVADCLAGNEEQQPISIDDLNGVKRYEDFISSLRIQW